MKKILFSIFFFAVFFTQSVSAEKINTQTPVTRNEAFQFIGEYIVTELPKSYKYISLEYKDVAKNSKLYDALQKLVYLDVLQNSSQNFAIKKQVNALSYYELLEKITGFDFLLEGADTSKLARPLTYGDLANVAKILKEIENTAIEAPNNGYDGWGFTPEEQQSFDIYFDVYSTLQNQFYGKQNVNTQNLIYSSIEGLTQASGDMFTTFFPPTKAQEFEESMNGEFEGIGAYVEMVQPGNFQIISPISGFPAEKAGLKGGDRVLEIDGVEITAEMTTNQATAMVKGPAGTTVKLKILRDGNELYFDVKREKIILNDVEYKMINGDTFYIQIRMFGDKVNAQFLEALKALKSEPNARKVVIDLRNNPGGYLDQVTEMLSQFVKKDEPVAVIKYLEGEFDYVSKGYNTLDFNNYKVYLLGNSGTASASEIMIGTIKDYLPNAKFIGEKTYGKGSVQTLRSYVDGSTLKYTIAKWYTGKTQTGIDHIGISPDVEVILDEEKLKSGVDTQMEWVKSN